MREPVSPLASTSLCLRILRRLLDDETLTMAQLSYVVENIHAPACGVTPGKQREAPHLGEDPEGMDATRAMLRSPLVLAQLRNARCDRSSAATPATAAHGHSGPAGTPRSPTVDLAAPVAVPSGCSLLSAEQQWGLFANLTALYNSQLLIVVKLGRTVQRLTVLLEKLQHLAEVREQGEWVPEVAVTEEDVTTWPTAPAAGSSPASPPPPPTSSPSARVGGDDSDGGYHELAAILSDFFTGEWVTHYAAEHMLYTTQFTTRIAPKVLELNRLWRWGASEALSTASAPASAASTSKAVSGAAVLRALGNTQGRKTLSEYVLFIDYLYRSLGSNASPQDVRVSCAAMPEDSCEVRTRRLRVDTPDVDLFLMPSGSGRRATAPGIKAGSFSGAGAAKPGDLPSMPADWSGFETLLMLLATPLASLRRQHHACRCILESGALLREGRTHLTKQYVDVLASHMMEEGALVMTELGQMDVAHLVQLIDDAPSTDDPHLPGVLQRLRGASAGGKSASSSFARQLIHYGRLKKRYGRGGRHERLVLLFNDCFCYAEESRSGRLRPRGGAALDAVRVLDVPEGYEGDDAENAVELVLRPATKRLIFYADTPEQKWQWVEAIRFATRQYRRHLSQQPQPPGAPLSRNTSTGANGITTSEAVHLGAHPLPQRSAVFSHRSRLGRQQRSDQHWQEFLETQRFLAISAAAQTGSTASVVAGTAGGGGGIASSAVTRRSSLLLPNSGTSRLGGSPGASGGAVLPAPLTCASGSDATTLPHVPSFNSSFATGPAGAGPLQRSHTQIEYDITPWSHQSSAPRRLRSVEAAAAVSTHGSPSGDSTQPSTTEAREDPRPAAAASVAAGVTGGRPPTASTTSGTPHRMPLMDRLDPAVASSMALPPVSPMVPRRSRAGPRAGAGVTTSPNRVLRFDSASRGGTETQDSRLDTPEPEQMQHHDRVPGDESPAPMPVEQVTASAPALVPHVADGEYDKDLEKLMQEHFDGPVLTDRQASWSSSSSGSSLIEDRSGDHVQPTTCRTGVNQDTPESAAGVMPTSHSAHPSSTASEGHSGYDDNEDQAVDTVDDSVVAMTAFSCPCPGRVVLRSPLTNESVPCGDELTAGGAGAPEAGRDAESPTSALTHPAAAPKTAHVDPNALLTLDTPEL